MKKTALLGVVLMGAVVLQGSQAFAQESPNPATTETPVTATFTTTDDNLNIVLPNDGSENDHDKNSVSGLLGIAYQPKAFSVSAQLQSSGSQEIPLASGTTKDKFHVGVKDSTRRKHNWTLKASLEWTGANKACMDGTTIKIAGGVVHKNNEGVLEATDVVTAVQTATTIGSSQEDLMKSVNTKTINGVYDYGFTSAKLAIPETKDIPGDTYTGKVHWNLSLAE